MLTPHTTHSSDSVAADRQGFAHFMLKEIHEQPEVLRSCLTYLLTPNWHAPSYPSSSRPPQSSAPFTLPLPPELFLTIEQIHIIASGTSRHAGMIAQYWLEQIAGIPTRLRSSPEAVAAPFPLTATTLTIAITQSGETADTLDALKIDRQRRLELPLPHQSYLLGITNQPESTIATLTDSILPTRAGVEIGVAATKTFLTQLIVLYCLALDLAHRRGRLTAEALEQRLVQLRTLPDQIAAILTQQERPKSLARIVATAQHCILLGRGVNWAIALEGALKLKETTYLHAEGYAAGEFMHGPIALLDAQVPVIAIAPTGESFQPMLAYARRVKTSGASTIGVTTADITTAADPAPNTAEFDHLITLPPVSEELSPFLTVIPLQLLAYYIAVERGLDVDRPRNITKTLTT